MSERFEKLLAELEKGVPLAELKRRYQLTADEEAALRAAALLKAEKTPALSPTAKKRIYAALRKQQPRRLRRTALAFVVSLLLLFSLSFAYASYQAPPASPLYPVRTTLERVAVQLAPSRALKAKILLRQLERRVAEIEKMRNGYREAVYEETLEKWERYRELKKNAVLTPKERKIIRKVQAIRKKIEEKKRREEREREMEERKELPPPPELDEQEEENEEREMEEWEEPEDDFESEMPSMPPEETTPSGEEPHPKKGQH